MMRMTTQALGLAAVLAAATVPAAADSWNDRTILKFSEPVMVPGATLQPGTYVFTLVDSPGQRHIVRILTEDRSKVIATTHAVPTKRQDPKGDVVLRFDPTEPGTPPALRAWFYPGSLYGHEFVYPEEQARQIAERTKTVVLSIDQAGTDMEKGTLRTYSPTGERVEWHGDPQTMREWNESRESRRAANDDASREERRAATAPVVQAAPQGMSVTVDQLEDEAARYTGKQISVDAEVEDVLGPRLFTIDEPRWGDLEGEILVHVPNGLAALVREDDKVTVAGTVKPFVRAEIDREWGWFGLVDPALDIRLSKRPVLVADRIVGGTSDVAMVIKAGDESKPAQSPITDGAALARADEAMVGRRVHLHNVTVKGTARDRGFFVDAGNRSLFVLPGRDGTGSAKPQGGTVTIRGVVLQMPREMDDHLKAPGELNGDIYVLATSLDQGSPSSN